MRETLLGRCVGSPALGLWGHKLAVAWADADRNAEINVAAGEVVAGTDSGDEFAPDIQIHTNFIAPDGEVGVAKAAGHLALAWVESGSLWAAPIRTTGADGAIHIADEVIGDIGMTAHDGRVVLAWRTSGNRVAITQSDDGIDWEDPTELAQTSTVGPRLASIEHPYHGPTLVLTIDDQELRVLTAVGNQFNSLDDQGVAFGLSHIGPVAVTPITAPAGPGPGFALVFSDGERIEFLKGDLDIELEGGSVAGPRLRGVPAGFGWQGDLIVGYVEDEVTSRLWVGSWASVFGVPDDLAARIGEPCDPRQCTDDPRLVCTVSGHTVLKNQEARIANARAGDILLTPADGDGVIGTILKAVRPPEFFDHMGLMVKDEVEIRHCTESKSRLIDDKHYYSGSLLGEPAPTDGLRPDLVKFGWPGPITQSIQDGFFDGWNDGRNPEWNYHRLGDPGSGQPGALTEEQRRAFYDKEFPENAFKITNLSFAPTHRDDHEGPVEPLVLRPSLEAEEEFPWVRWARGRVVAESFRTLGHYRFFAYSDGRTGTDPNLFAPPVGDPEWSGLRAGADWAAGRPGLVCSNFVWLAAIRALAGLAPPFLLDVDPLTPEDGTAREQSPPKIDGLFAYGEGERAEAAAALHAWIVDKVEETVKQNVDKLWPPLAQVGTASLIGVLVGSIIPPAGLAAAIAGLALSPSQIAGITFALTDMPQQVANGVCNAFALDRAEAIDDTSWESPGTGVAVSPDGIGNFWDTPMDRGEQRSGLWGTKVPMRLANPRPEMVEEGTLQLSPGVARVMGTVTFQGQVARGAEVQIGCRRATVGREGVFLLEVPANEPGILQLVRVQADWQSPPGMLTGSVERELPPGDVQLGTIELDPPPEWRRRIEIFGELVMVFKPLIGHDRIDHHRFSNPRFLQVDPAVIAADPAVGVAAATATISEDTAVRGRHYARLSGTFRVLSADLDGLPGVPPRPPGAADLSVVFDWAYELFEEAGDDDKKSDDEQDDVQRGTLVIPPGETVVLDRNLHDGEAPPNEAHSNVTIVNMTNPA